MDCLSSFLALIKLIFKSIPEDSHNSLAYKKLPINKEINHNLFFAISLANLFHIMFRFSERGSKSKELKASSSKLIQLSIKLFRNGCWLESSDRHPDLNALNHSKKICQDLDDDGGRLDRVHRQRQRQQCQPAKRNCPDISVIRSFFTWLPRSHISLVYSRPMSISLIALLCYPSWWRCSIPSMCDTSVLVMPIHTHENSLLSFPFSILW